MKSRVLPNVPYHSPDSRSANFSVFHNHFGLYVDAKQSASNGIKVPSGVHHGDMQAIPTVIRLHPYM